MCIDEKSVSAAGKLNAARNDAPHPTPGSRLAAHECPFLIDTPAIRNSPNSLKIVESDPF
jgi:hypothetical protein